MRFQFSLRELMAFVCVVAVGCAGLLRPSPLTASVVFTLAIAALFLAILCQPALTKREPGVYNRVEVAHTPRVASRGDRHRSPKSRPHPGKRS